jgi:cell shape-determining protein MreC
MTVDRFISSLKPAIKRAVVLLVSVTILFSLTPAAALAMSASSQRPHLIALAASSRFAAPSDEELQIQKMSEQRRQELREKRRQWQKEASASASNEAEEVAEVEKSAKDKLNLDEIAEENPVTN